MSGQITRKEIIQDEAIVWGPEYAKNVDLAVKKNKEFVDGILLMVEANNKLRGSSNAKEYADNQKRVNEVSEKTLTVWKEQIQLENNLISTKKKNELATEGTNRALTKERILLAETNKEIKLQAREQLGMITAYEKLNRARAESQKRLADLLSAEKKNIAEIIVAQREFDKLDARVKAVDASIKNYSKNIGNYSSAFQGLNETARNLLSTFGVVTGLALFGTIVKDIFSVVKDFDRQLIAVGKTTNITGDDLKQFGSEVVELGNKLDGVTVDGLIQSAEVAGQLGVTGTANILKFSEAIEKLKLTSNIISDEQVGQFAKFIEVSSDSFDNADRLASVITQLGNSFATTEAEVLANATEIQKGVAVYNTSAQGILALGAATSTLGSEAESSRSAVQSTFAVINNAIATGANLEKVLKLTGLTQKELSKQFNQDATGVFVKFVGGLNKAKNEGENLSRVLNDVEITEKRAFTVIGSLAANYGILEQSIAQANKEYSSNSALNKEVAAASESISSIIGDLRDKWEAYVLSTNDANSGSEALTKTLKFLRDNFKEIINFVLKFGAVFLTYLGVIKAYNFYIAASTALQTAWTAGQIRFALATGIGTESILAQAAAARAATTAQEGLNLATKATPWGIILAALTAVVVAYMVFNDELSDAEKNIQNIIDKNKELQESEKGYSSDRDKTNASRFKAIEDEIRLKKAQGGNSDQLDKEEIARKKEVLQASLDVFSGLKAVELERTKSEIDGSRQRIAQMEIEKKSAKITPRRTDEIKELIEAEKTKLELKKATYSENSRLTIEEQARLNKQIQDLDKNNAVKDAEIKAESDKKIIEARKKRLKELYDLEKKAADDLFKLQQFRLQGAIDADKEIVDNEKASFDDRLDALLESNQLIEAKTREAAEYELKQFGTYNEKKGFFIRDLSDLQINEIIRTGKTSEKLTSEQQLIYEKYQNDLTKSTKKGEEDRKKLIDNQVAVIQKSIDAKNQTADTELNNRIAQENKLYQNALDVAKDNFELVEQATIEHERKLLKITQSYSKEKLQNQIDTMQQLLDENAKLPIGEQISAEKRAEIENKLSDYRKQLSEVDVANSKITSDAIVENEKNRVQRLEDLTREANDRTRELAENLASSLIDLTNAIFDAKIQNIDSEIEKVTSSYDEQIRLAGDDARKKDFLEKEKERKTKELERVRKKEVYKAAVFNRIISLAQIAFDLGKTIVAINAAAAAIDAVSFGTAGTPYRAIQIPLAIGTAAVQAGSILATPLPKYKDGRKGGPAEIAWVGDGGVSEIITSGDGSNPRLTPNVPTLTKLGKDDIVHKSMSDYENYVKQSMILNFKNENQNLTVSFFDFHF